MPLPPDVLFHRYFQALSPAEREHYRGKYDLNRLEPPAFQSLLIAIQEALNEMLRGEKLHTPGHVDHPHFHLDYIDSSVPNAVAFRYADYSFIGITIPLIYTLWDASHLLSRSETIASLLGIHLRGDERDAVRVVLFRTMLFFVVSHEWTHHVHGHVDLRTSESNFFNEILDRAQTRGLEAQTLEIDADGYAAYHVLANLIDGSARPLALDLLKLKTEPANIQNEVLFSCFVVAVMAFFFARPPSIVDKANIYTITHPPQAARMNCLMQQAMSWCAKNHPGLDEAWMLLNRYSAIMETVAETTREMTGGTEWAAQIAFLRTEDGSEYVRRLEQSVETYVQSLSRGHEGGNVSI